MHINTQKQFPNSLSSQERQTGTSAINNMFLYIGKVWKKRVIIPEEQERPPVAGAMAEAACLFVPSHAFSYGAGGRETLAK